MENKYKFFESCVLFKMILSSSLVFVSNIQPVVLKTTNNSYYVGSVCL